MVISLVNTKAVIAYLDFVDKGDLLRVKHELTAKECLVLRVVMRHYINKETLRVRQLIDMDLIASPATIHGVIKKLVAKKMLILEADTVDGRVKFLVPSNEAIDLLSKLGKLVKP
jgi:DNA-binding MarR family transcriptional regulator